MHLKISCTLPAQDKASDRVATLARGSASFKGCRRALYIRVCHHGWDTTLSLLAVSTCMLGTSWKAPRFGRFVMTLRHPPHHSTSCVIVGCAKSQGWGLFLRGEVLCSGIGTRCLQPSPSAVAYYEPSCYTATDACPSSAQPSDL